MLERYKIGISNIDKLSFARRAGLERVINATGRAEKEFTRDIKLTGLNEFTHHTSSLHGFNDVRVQALIVAIPSNNEAEMQNKAYLAFVTHFVDDFFDRPDLPPTPAQMREKRGDIDSLVHSVGNLGKFVDLAFTKVKNPTGFKKGLERLMYGGLIQLAESKDEQKMYLSEYKKIGLKHVDKPVYDDILKIRDIPYWMTTKTIQELFWSTEPKENLTLAELWTLVYAPAIYLHDCREEKKNGELNFYDQKLPTLDEMRGMLTLAKRHIPNYEDELKESRARQLEILINAFTSVLPKEILSAYNELADNIKLR